MAATDLPHFTDPQFAPIRAELCRLFIRRKADLGLADRADADIEAGLDEIVWYLWRRTALAVHAGDADFLQRFNWLVEVFQRLNAGQSVAPFDG